MKFEADKTFKNRAKATFGQFEFDVGILKDRPHREAHDRSRGLTSVAGGPARKISRKSSKKTVGEISSGFEQSRNYLSRPFETESRELKLFTEEAVKLCLGQSTYRKVEKLLQAVVRTPILKKKYGRNSLITASIKGFNRFMIDTGQFFNAIKAKVTRV